MGLSTLYWRLSIRYVSSIYTLVVQIYWPAVYSNDIPTVESLVAVIKLVKKGNNILYQYINSSS